MKTCSLPTRHARHGFTLVELLVVIVVILVLAALSVVAIGTVKQKAEAANATTALRQVGIGQVAYAAENHGAINTLRDTGENREEGGPNAWVSNTFWGRMQPYMFAGVAQRNQQQLKRDLESSLKTLFNTPDVRKMTNTPFQGAASYGDLSGLPVPLGFNSSVRAPWNQPARRVASFDDPSRIIYCSYGRYFFNANHGREYRPLPQPGTSGSNGIYYTENRQAFICFLDGHVESMSPPIETRLFE